MACTVFQVLVVVLGYLGMANSLRCYECIWTTAVGGEEWCETGNNIPESAISDNCDYCMISETRVSGELTTVSRDCVSLDVDMPVTGCGTALGITTCNCDYKDLCNEDTETADSSAGIPGATAKLTAFFTVLAWIAAKYLF